MIDTVIDYIHTEEFRSYVIWIVIVGNVGTIFLNSMTFRKNKKLMRELRKAIAVYTETTKEVRRNYPEIVFSDPLLEGDEEE